LASADIDDHNRHRFHNAIGCFTLAGTLAGGALEILASRERKRTQAWQRRAEDRRLQSKQQATLNQDTVFWLR
jgi:hypothetical protein